MRIAANTNIPGTGAVGVKLEEQEVALILTGNELRMLSAIINSSTLDIFSNESYFSDDLNDAISSVEDTLGRLHLILQTVANSGGK